MHETLRVLVLEDNNDDVELIIRELKRANGFEILYEVAHKETEIREALTQRTWDLIICDYFLTSFDAPRVLTMLEHLGIDIPFVLVSGLADEDLAASSLRIRGVHEFVNKNALSRLGPVIHRELRVYKGFEEMIRSFISFLELRDLETRGHSERVVTMTERLARAMGVNESEIIHLRRGALLHDIGKIAIPDKILLKNGPLLESERQIMQAHTILGYEALRRNEFLKRSLHVVIAHHEKWNGQGYPYKLMGKEIPLGARIFSVVDVYDALISVRPYKDSLEKVDALRIIEMERSMSFDPDIVDVFLKLVRNDP